MKQFHNLDGRPIISLYGKGRSKTYLVHALVASAFIGKRPKGYDVNHKDGNKLNNYIDNLEYITSAENKYHAVANGFIVCKLSNFQFRVLRRCWLLRKRGIIKLLTTNWGVTKATLYNALKGKTKYHGQQPIGSVSQISRRKLVY